MAKPTRIASPPEPPAFVSKALDGFTARSTLKTAACTYAAAVLTGNGDVIAHAWRQLEDAAIPFTVFHKA